MKLTFLGTGTSTGVPSIGCACEVCRSADPRDNRLRCSALLTVGSNNILIDAGPDFRQQILRAGSPPLDALLITHTHYDHVGGIDDLRPYCYPDGFDIYAQAYDIDDLKRKVPYCFAEKPYPGAPVLGRLSIFSGRFVINIIQKVGFYNIITYLWAKIHTYS